ncbi:MAG: dockerin type I domain-containing protein [Nanoarchaeota archaeon]
MAEAMAELSDIVNKENNTKSYSLGRILLYAGMSLLYLLSNTASAQNLGRETEPVKEKAKIAFVSERDGNREIYLMEDDGSNQRNVSNNPDFDDVPMWSPDGRFLAFTTLRGKPGISVVDIGGGDNSVKFYATRAGDPRYEFERPQCIRWQPKEKVPANLEGYTIYYTAVGKQRGNNTYRLDLSTGGAKQTIGDYPIFSADGKIVIFEIDRGDLTKGHRGDRDVYASEINPDGRAISGVRLTDTKDNTVEDIFRDSVLYSEIDWDVKVVELRGNSRFVKSQIMRINTDGTGKKTLTEPNLSTNLNARWSPDGSKIVYMVGEADKNKDKIYSIRLMDKDGSNKMILTKDATLRGTGSYLVDPLSWARDGKEIFYSSKDFEIKAVDLSGKIRTLTNSGKDYGPAVQPPLKISPLETAVFPPWDVNQDGVVSVFDLSLVGQHFGKSADDKSIPPYVFPDVNKDKVVNIQDLVLVGNHFGEVYAPPPLAPGRALQPTSEMEIKNIKKVYNLLLKQSLNEGGYELHSKPLNALRDIIEINSAKENMLSQNYPNPFNSETWIPFKIANPSHVGVYVWNSGGKLIRSVDLGYLQAGSYIDKNNAIYWDGKNQVGEALSSGNYFLTLKADNWSSTKKITLVK